MNQPSGYIILNIGEVTMENDEVVITDKELQEKIDYALQSKKPVLLTISETVSGEDGCGFCVISGNRISLIVTATTTESLTFSVVKTSTTYKAQRLYQEV